MSLRHQVTPSLRTHTYGGFTVPAAASALGMPCKALYGWIAEGSVPTFQRRVRRLGPPGTHMQLHLTATTLRSLSTRWHRGPKGAIAMRQHVRPGTSYEAARKWVRRQQQRGVPLDQLEVFGQV